MTRAEKQKIKEAIHLLSTEGDDYEKGMIILHHLIGSKYWTENIGPTKTISLNELRADNRRFTLPGKE